MIEFHKIQIIAMRTWGELGNFLAAHSVARVVRAGLPLAEVSVVEAEELVPEFREVGAKIRNLSRTSANARVRNQRYLELMGQCASIFPAGFENDATGGPTLGALSDHFRHTSPDLVIAAKGVIARVCLAVRNREGIPLPIANFLTNHGLLELPIHHVPGADLHFTQFAEGRDILVKRIGVPLDRVALVGPLVVANELESSLVDHQRSTVSLDEPSVGETPVVTMFCNRGGREYMSLLQELVTHREIEIVFIVYNDEELFTAATDLKTQSGHPRLHIYDQLSQRDYLARVRQLSHCKHSLLITKTGPNTVIEAAYFGVPVLTLNSGLPMEDWVSRLVVTENFGRTTDSVEQLTAILNSWLHDPWQLTILKENARLFGQRMEREGCSGRSMGTAIRRLAEMGFASLHARATLTRGGLA